MTVGLNLGLDTICAILTEHILQLPSGCTGLLNWFLWRRLGQQAKSVSTMTVGQLNKRHLVVFVYLLVHRAYTTYIISLQ